MANGKFSAVLDAVFDDPALAALRGQKLPNQREADVELVEAMDLLGYTQSTVLWKLTPGNRFKKSKRAWQVGVLATCVGFCLGDALGRRNTLDDANREYMTKYLDLAQIGAGSLLEPRDFTARGAHGSRVLEAALNGARIKVKDPLDLMVKLGASWTATVQTMRETGNVPDEYLP